MTLKSVSVMLVAAVALTACGGGGRKGPDEFEVLERQPLVVPPEAELTPPRPGEPRAQEINPGQAAYEALFPGKKLKRPDPKSSGEYSLLKQLGPSSADIRSNVGGDKKSDVVKKRLLIADMLEADERTFRPDNIEIYRVTSN